jgi:hypothetical protein
MTPDIRRTQPSNEYAADENCFILEMSNDADDPDVSIARARVQPGMTTEWHRLEGIAERYVILRGTGRSGSWRRTAGRRQRGRRGPDSAKRPATDHERRK